MERQSACKRHLWSMDVECRGRPTSGCHTALVQPRIGWLVSANRLLLGSSKHMCPLCDTTNAMFPTGVNACAATDPFTTVVSVVLFSRASSARTGFCNIKSAAQESLRACSAAGLAGRWW